MGPFAVTFAPPCPARGWEPTLTPSSQSLLRVTPETRVVGRILKNKTHLLSQFPKASEGDPLVPRPLRIPPVLASPSSLRACHAQPKSRGHAQVRSPRNSGSPGWPCHPAQSPVITTPRLFGAGAGATYSPHDERPGGQPPGGSHQQPSLCWALRGWEWLGFTARPRYHPGGRNSCLQVPTSHATSWSCGLGQMPSPLGPHFPLRWRKGICL